MTLTNNERDDLEKQLFELRYENDRNGINIWWKLSFLFCAIGIPLASWLKSASLFEGVFFIYGTIGCLLWMLENIRREQDIKRLQDRLDNDY